MTKENIELGIDKTSIMCYKDNRLNFDGEKMTLDVSNNYRTSDTALAAYLIAEGYGIPDIEYNGSRAFFLFSKENPELEKSINAWDTARAETNAVLFFNAYQNLLRRIKERY